MELADQLFKEFSSGAPALTDVSLRVEALKELRERESRVMQWSEEPDALAAGSEGMALHPMAEILAELGRAVEAGEEESWTRLLSAFEEAASLHGYDDIAEEASRIRFESASLGLAALQDRIRRLEAIVPGDLLALLPVRTTGDGEAFACAPARRRTHRMPRPRSGDGR